jgi:hypothetical protein
VVRLYRDSPDRGGLTFSTYSIAVGLADRWWRRRLRPDEAGAYTSSDSGCGFPGAPGSMQMRHSHSTSSVPAIVPRTMPAIAPPESVDGQLLLLALVPVDWRGTMRGACGFSGSE